MKIKSIRKSPDLFRIQSIKKLYRVEEINMALKGECRECGKVKPISSCFEDENEDEDVFSPTHKNKWECRKCSNALLIAGIRAGRVAREAEQTTERKELKQKALNLMSEMLKRNAGSPAILRAFVKFYAKQGKTDLDWVKRRMKHFKRIARER